MGGTFGNLKENEKQFLKSYSRKFSDSEIQERFAKRDNKVVFRIIRKMDRALAGPLDIYELEKKKEILKAEEIIPAEKVLPEEISEYEVAEITLIPPEEFDYEPDITEEDRKASEPIDESMSKFKGYYAKDKLVMGVSVEREAEAEAAELPPVVDHRASQSPIKNQAGRGTCVSHASMGLLEAYEHIPDDLSEQYTHYKFMEFLNLPHDQDSGIKTTDAAPFLARLDGRICLEADWPYIPNQETISTMVANGTYGPPQAALNNQTYGIGAYKIITDQGLTGESIKNTRYLEALLYGGYNIVIGTWVSWDDKDNNGILDPVLDPSGQPIGRGGHAMLVVGYDRPSEYFIVKNSWDRGWGHDGYAYLHYNYIRSCFKYGFVIDTVVPPALTSLPRKLTQAPYTTEKVSRSQLRAAILFIKTSRERYAICEAYAGDNLLLRNLRVYNADGSIHLEKDSLVIRGTYLCDIDSGQETNLDADFWWEAERPGVNYLVPRNNAKICVAFDLGKLNSSQINATTLSSAPIASEDLDYAVVVGRTTSSRPFKMLVYAKPDNRLQISYLELFNPDGNRYRYATNKYIPSSWTYNLDTLRTARGRDADIWWHVISSGVGFLEHYSKAHTQLLWSL